MTTIEGMIDDFYNGLQPRAPTWTLKQVVDARRAMVEAIKKYGYLPIANLWMGPLITKEIFETQTPPKSLTPEEEDALLKELHELNQWLRKWDEEHPGMM